MLLSSYSRDRLHTAAEEAAAAEKNEKRAEDETISTKVANTQTPEAKTQEVYIYNLV